MLYKRNRTSTVGNITTILIKKHLGIYCEEYRTEGTVELPETNILNQEC